MAAPQVQTLAEVMASLDPAFAGQEQVVQKKQAGLGAKYDAQRAGLTAEKGQGFNAINNQAVSRGGSFSGVPIDEQATYLSTKYLPGLQAADSQQNDEDLELQGQLATIGTQKTTSALGTIEKQKSDLNSWNMQQAQLEAQARENALNRAAQAAEGAASRAFSASQQAAKGPTTQAVTSHMNDWASKRWGGDKRLSPTDFKAGYQEFFSYAGGSVDDYVAIMQRYVNNSHAKDYTF